MGASDPLGRSDFFPYLRFRLRLHEPKTHDHVWCNYWCRRVFPPSWRYQLSYAFGRTDHRWRSVETIPVYDAGADSPFIVGEGWFWNILSGKDKAYTCFISKIYDQYSVSHRNITTFRYVLAA
jgi:hypothetical protein